MKTIPRLLLLLVAVQTLYGQHVVPVPPDVYFDASPYIEWQDIIRDTSVSNGITLTGSNHYFSRLNDQWLHVVQDSFVYFALRSNYLNKARTDGFELFKYNWKTGQRAWSHSYHMWTDSEPKWLIGLHVTADSVYALVSVDEDRYGFLDYYSSGYTSVTSYDHYDLRYVYLDSESGVELGHRDIVIDEPLVANAGHKSGKYFKLLDVDLLAVYNFGLNGAVWTLTYVDLRDGSILGERTAERYSRLLGKDGASYDFSNWLRAVTEEGFTEVSVYRQTDTVYFVLQSWDDSLGYLGETIVNDKILSDATSSWQFGKSALAMSQLVTDGPFVLYISKVVPEGIATDHFAIYEGDLVRLDTLFPHVTLGQVGASVGLVGLTTASDSTLMISDDLVGFTSPRILTTEGKPYSWVFGSMIPTPDDGSILLLYYLDRSIKHPLQPTLIKLHPSALKF